MKEHYSDFKLTQEIAKEFWDYDPETGIFIWKFRDRKWFATEGSFKTTNTKFAGKRAFYTVDGKGYYHQNLYYNFIERIESLGFGCMVNGHYFI